MDCGYTLSLQLKADAQGKVKADIYWWPLHGEDSLLNYYRTHPDAHPVEPVPTVETGPLIIKRGTCTYKRLEEFKDPTYWTTKSIVKRDCPIVCKSHLINSEALPCKPCADTFFSQSAVHEWTPLAFHHLLDRLNKVECHHRMSKTVRK